MIRLEGARDLPLPPAELWAKLTDARFLVSCVPDVESVSQVAGDSATFVIRPSLAFVRGNLEVALQVAEKAPPASATVLLNSRGIGSSSAVDAAFTLTPTDAGSHVHWTAEVKELGGLLKLVPQGLIRGAAQKVIEDIWSTIAEQLRATS
jgi:carbon monoxide dehydrogenase subunit G